MLYLDKVYSSPAAATVAVKKRGANGWWFWRVDGGQVLQELRDQLLNGDAATESDLPQSEELTVP